MAEGGEPLETLQVTSEAPGDIIVGTLAAGQRLTAFRYGQLILIKNTGNAAIIVRGRQAEVMAMPEREAYFYDYREGAKAATRLAHGKRYDLVDRRVIED